MSLPTAIPTRRPRLRPPRPRPLRPGKESKHAVPDEPDLAATDFSAGVGHDARLAVAGIDVAGHRRARPGAETPANAFRRRLRATRCGAWILDRADQQARL